MEELRIVGLMLVFWLVGGAIMGAIVRYVAWLLVLVAMDLRKPKDGGDNAEAKSRVFGKLVLWPAHEKGSRGVVQILGYVLITAIIASATSVVVAVVRFLVGG
ncbi:MAG: hypothetical protein AAGB48_08345 [Planctomycetota bacterium]